LLFLCRRAKGRTPFAQFPAEAGDAKRSVNPLNDWRIGELDTEQHRECEVDALDCLAENLERFEAL
jgi:hypothetical protein